MSMLFVVIISAILLATAMVILLFLIQARPDAPLDAPTFVAVNPFPQQVMVEGMLVVLNTDPNKAVHTLVEGPSLDGVAIAPTIDPFLLGPTPFLTPTVVTDLPQATPFPADLPLPPTPVPSQIIFVPYTVQSGDSLYSIAEAQNSAIELMALHGIDDDDLIPGNVLNLPIANPAFCPGRRAYVVRDRDTLFRIAVQFNTTATELRAINAIGDDNRINVTQVICVP